MDALAGGPTPRRRSTTRRGAELACQDLAKSFGPVTVLEGVSFDFYKGR